MRRFCLLPLLLLFLVSCNQSGIGIFYSISREQPLEDATLPNAVSVSGMVKGTSKYYVCAGGLYSRDIQAELDAPWSDKVPTPSAELSLCIKLVKFGSKMYGLFTNYDATVTAIYSSGLDTVAWEEAGSFDKPIVALAASGTYLFATVREDYATYVTKRSTDGFATMTSLSLEGQYTAVTDAEDFLAETWLLSGTKLYSGTDITYAPVTGTDVPSSSGGFGGVYASASLACLFVSSAEGKVYCTQDGTTWVVSAVTDSNDEPVALFDIEEVPVLDADVILVGAKNGYYDIVFENGYTQGFSLQTPGTAEAGEFSSSDANYLNIDLRTSVVRFFFVDKASNTLFACTSGNGLWINPISGATADTLVRKWDRQ